MRSHAKNVLTLASKRSVARYLNLLQKTEFCEPYNSAGLTSTALVVTASMSAMPLAADNNRGTKC